MIIIILILLYLCFRLVPPVARFCQTYFPSNIVLSYFRRRDRLKWGVPVGLAGTAFYYFLYWLLLDGYEQWDMDIWGILARVGGIFIVISLLKFVLFIPISAILLARYRVGEALLLRQVNRQLRREARAEGTSPPKFSAQQRRELRNWARQALISPH